MNAKLILNIAVGLLRARIRQSVVAAAGVTFGIGMFIALVSFMNGLNQLLDGLILNRLPHVRLYNEIKPSKVQAVEQASKYAGYEHFIRSVKPKDRGKELYNSQAILKSLAQDPRVVGVAPKAITQVFYNTGTIELGGVIDGIDVVMEDKLFHLSNYIIEGSLQDLATVSNSIILGKGIAQKMMVDLGDVVRITAPNGQQATLKVVGVVQLGVMEIDNIQSYASIETVQKLLGQPSAYLTDIQVNLTDLNLAPATAREYAALYGLEATDIQTANSQFETGSNIRSIISYVVGITLLIVAGFGIYNILNMMIYEKMDAIAILKATGFSAQDVQAIFLSLSMIIGVAGGVMGLLLGYGISVIIDNVPFKTESLPTITTYPVYFNPVFYLIGITFALVTTYFAGLFPARKASKTDPVSIIRGK
ncbi:FtsX-like permease family protein [Nibribacter ruber]|uniref:FtsX-like permease family protein n=1 Tax=Nibribacter ruber TaxID=2698458 RepID=A0A6P1P346_9BACT|nr:FtsX-like permease family protein [Nibribacter ruber]QHL88810.1 FtsX-like permease family protein [Nibribacter ruber]